MPFVYAILTFLFGLLTPILAYRLFRDKIKGRWTLIFFRIFTVVASLFCGLILPIYVFLSSAFGYPVVKKDINADFYFTQQEYGWVGSMPGKIVRFYKRKFFWKDEMIGRVDLMLETGDVDIEVFNEQMDFKSVRFRIKKRVLLDTIISFDKEFDFKYWDRNK